MTESTPTENTSLTKEEESLKRFFYLSFRYSQGSNSLQTLFYEFGISNNFIDKKLIKTPCPSYITGIVPPKAHEQQRSKAMAPETIIEEWNKFCELNETIGGVSDIDQQELQRKIVTEFVQVDVLRISNTRKNRQKWTEEIEEDSEKDNGASFVRHIINNPIKTGHPAFDNLFQAIKEKGLFESSERYGSLKEWWEFRHPGRRFDEFQTKTN